MNKKLTSSDKLCNGKIRGYIKEISSRTPTVNIYCAFCILKSL